MHFLSTYVHCLIRYAPIVLLNVNRFQLATVYMSITLPRVFLTCRLESPALNQAHPVFPGMKPNWTQSCLLDCTGWFSSVFQALYPQLPIPTVLVTVVVSSSVSACSFVSQYPLPQCTIDLFGTHPRSPLDSDSCLLSMYFSPVILGLDPHLPMDPTWITFDNSDYRQMNFGLFDYSVVYKINHWFLPGLGLAIGFCSLALTKPHKHLWQFCFDSI